jgi:hypothetical protein
MLFHRFRILCLIALLSLLNSSCGNKYYSGHKGGDSRNYGTLSNPDYTQTSRAYGSHEANGIVIHNNRNLRYSRELSNKAAGVEGVRAAIVMHTDYNAYAAILIDNSVHGTLRRGSIKETNNAGTTIGTYDTETLNQAVENWRIATGINNYTTVENHEDLNPAFKQRIAIAIRQVDPTINNVFISANRDFINQLNAYAIESNWGTKPLEYRINEFNGTANRLFGVSEGLKDK